LIAVSRLPAVVNREPSGNLIPPCVDSIVPATVRRDVGVSVPIPTAPNLSSKMVESPMTEEPNDPIHLANRPNVPLPTTGVLAASVKPEAETDALEILGEFGINEKPLRPAGRACAKRVDRLMVMAESAGPAVLRESEIGC